MALLKDAQWIDRLQDVFAQEADVELAILIGSRATGTAGDHSDWDIAIQWNQNVPRAEQIGRAESLRRCLAAALGVADGDIDLIDIPSARLAMRAVIAEDDLVLKGENTLAWSHFLLRTWSELEEFYWERQHAA